MRIREAVAALAAIALGATAALAGTVVQTNLVSDGSIPAVTTDPNLVNAWGISANATGGGPFWVSGNGAGVSTLYDSNGTPFPPGSPLVVTIPPPRNGGTEASPTGQVFNPTMQFQIGQPPGQPALFLFATEQGTITAWNPNVQFTRALTVVNRSAQGAVYKGLALARTPAGAFLLGADFGNRRIDVFDGRFRLIRSFTDPTVPAEYGPFNVQVLDGAVFVTFAKKQPNSIDNANGPGTGFVDEVDVQGNILRRLVSRGPLNAPWGLVIAPTSFGPLAGALLVGNFGDGRINAFDRQTGAAMGPLMTAGGTPLHIDGLWGLIRGNGGLGGTRDKIYFSAGPNDEAGGLFGSLAFVATP